MAPNLGVACSLYAFKVCVNGVTEARKILRHLPRVTSLHQGIISFQRRVHVAWSYQSPGPNWANTIAAMAAAMLQNFMMSLTDGYPRGDDMDYVSNRNVDTNNPANSVKTSGKT
jgi:hypothetical protein